jgi:hypothetical protein
MEGSAGYLEQLESALEKRSQWLESTQIPLLKSDLASFDALFEGAMAMLIRKGLLREDPYNYEQAFTDILIPGDTPLPEFENSDEVSYRLAAFRRQLKYVCTELTFDLESLGLARLKKISALILFINWLEFGEGSSSPTTRAFVRVFMKVRMSPDSMASQILKDSEVQIVKTVRHIRGLVAELIAYHRESWKAEMRRKVLTRYPPASPEEHVRKEEALHAMRRGFGQAMEGKPWYPALAEELLEEETAADGEARKQKVLASLVVAEPETAEESPLLGGRAILMDAVRILCRPHEDLAKALAILEENERLLLESRGSGGGWLKRLLGVRTSPKGAERTYKVEYSEPGVPLPKTEPIDFTSFLAETRKKASLLAALSSGTGPAHRRLSQTGDEQLAAFLDKELNEVLLIHRRLGSLNTLFQARSAQEKRTSRGIKIELLTMKNSIVNANRKRHEFRDAG